ncbi:MAG: peptide chain release factor N(5)-glutamine methyltransferase [Spirochaetes bacterium]|nr:peptide chain release factor N(5)-glutamine methyltransferase [Spirochaetota bacterium]
MRVSQMLADVTARLREAGVPGPVLDAELLVAHAMDTERYRLRVDDDRDLDPSEVALIKRLAGRRARFEPVAYLLGRKEFYSLDFIVNRHVLIPRPETELLVDMVVYYARQNARVADIGTGSGAIAVAVKHARADLEVHATDISPKALAVARKNAARLLGKKSIMFHQGDLFAPLPGMRFQVIAVNPPYVDRGVAGSLQKDLSYEPEEALFSGGGGRDTIERVLKDAPSHLEENGVLIIEIGEEMGDFATRAGKDSGFAVSVLRDYSGLDRIAIMKK